jgi:hypothetical protein
MIEIQKRTSIYMTPIEFCLKWYHSFRASLAIVKCIFSLIRGKWGKMGYLVLFCKNTEVV